MKVTKMDETASLIELSTKSATTSLHLFPLLRGADPVHVLCFPSCHYWPPEFQGSAIALFPTLPLEAYGMGLGLARSNY